MRFEGCGVVQKQKEEEEAFCEYYKCVKWEEEVIDDHDHQGRFG